jgi:hypothetical protein
MASTTITTMLEEHQDLADFAAAAAVLLPYTLSSGRVTLDQIEDRWFAEQSTVLLRPSPRVALIFGSLIAHLTISDTIPAVAAA